MGPTGEKEHAHAVMEYITLRGLILLPMHGVNLPGMRTMLTSYKISACLSYAATYLHQSAITHTITYHPLSHIIVSYNHHHRPYIRSHIYPPNPPGRLQLCFHWKPHCFTFILGGYNSKYSGDYTSTDCDNVLMLSSSGALTVIVFYAH